MKRLVEKVEHAPYVLGDDLLGGIGEVEVDEISKQGHGCLDSVEDQKRHGFYIEII